MVDRKGSNINKRDSLFDIIKYYYQLVVLMFLHLVLKVKTIILSRVIEDASLPDINRTATDTSGSIGSLYDACRDCLCGKVNIKNDKSKISNLNITECELLHEKKSPNKKLLQMLNIEDDLRLSILLNLASKTGLAALMDYPYIINERTRLLRYTYTSREENIWKNTKKRTLSMPNKNATHIVTGITWGIDVLIVLELPQDSKLAKTANDALKDIIEALNHNYDPKTLNMQNFDMNNIINMKVYSNIPSIERTNSLQDIYQKIYQIKQNDDNHHPIRYTLSPLQDVVPRNLVKNYTDSFLDTGYNSKLEQYFLGMSTLLKDLESYFNDNNSSVLCEHFAKQLFDIHMKLLDAKKKYDEQLKTFAGLLSEWRQNDTDTTEIDKALGDKQQITLKKSITDIAEAIECLKLKEKFIIHLRQKQIQYCNVNNYNLAADDNEQIIERILIRDAQSDRILCSSDTLNKNRNSEFEPLRDRLVEQRKENPNIRLFYADFSYCSFQLSKIIVLPDDNITNIEHTKTLDNSTVPQTASTTSASSNDDDVINLLLLGETGVGKSTFINAFVNYLTFETLSKAESNSAVVLIPVSFMITSGDDFEEHTVKFGTFDKTNNEDFNHPGQSVTQRCKSYIFKLPGDHGKKLRIIDTPGFGDTRGLAQDDVNMQHILEYINNLSHLNAICFLIKPNVARLSSYFRTCVTQLLDLLGSNIRQNISFCFTSSRSTFYTPGDTAPSLRKLLESFSDPKIPFTKTNTFCFDSESFRYLVALKQSIPFGGIDRDEYENSWINSTKEAKRLINHLCNNDQNIYSIENKWQSVVHAQMEISHMIRPILETIRNTLRNIILFRMNIKDAPIKLIAEPIDYLATGCLRCKPKTNLLANFRIIVREPHEALPKCEICECSPYEHVPTHYILKYEVSNNPINQDDSKMNNQLSLLFNASIELIRFLKKTSYPLKEDPFIVGLQRMIQEEQQLCEKQEANYFNGELLNELEKFKNKYQNRMNEIQSNQYYIDLAVIYERIAITRDYPNVKEQMQAMKETQKNIMKYYEQIVSNNYRKTPSRSIIRTA